MLARNFRLKKNDMDRIYKKGQRVAQDLFLVRYLPNRAGHSRFSVVISKKVLAKAHDRNHAKRQIYQLIWQAKDLWQTKSLDIALVLKKYQEEKISADINYILGQIK